MTEEIIIFEQDGNIVGITKEGKYFESYKTTENVAILRAAGLYIKRLEQENRELKETVKDLNQSIQNCNIQRTKMYKVLEEIKVISDNYNLTVNKRRKQIEDKINEVLK